MKLTSLFLTLGLFAAQSLQAADLCTPLELEDPAIKERGRIMHFPGDRSVTLLGHEQVGSNVLERFALWVESRDDELNNDEWRGHVGKFIKKNDKTLAHAKQDLGYLRAALWKAQEPVFVAIESRDNDVLKHAARAMGFRSALSQAFWKRQLEDTMLLRDAELVYMGGTLYSYLYDSELKGKYELLGMQGKEHAVSLQALGKETMSVAKTRLATVLAKQKSDKDMVEKAATLQKSDNDTVKKATTIQKPEDDTVKKATAIQKSDDDTVKKATALQQSDEDMVKKAMALVIGEMNKAYGDIAEILVYDHEKIRTRFEDRTPNLDPKVRGAALFYLYGYLDYLRGMKKGDVLISRKLANHKRSGVFFVGEKRLVSLANLLQVECKAIRAGSPIPEEVPPQPVIDEM